MTQAQHISLRALEPADLGFLFHLENDPENWEVSNTRIPFSKHTLKLYIDSIKDIYTDKQLRLVICNENAICGLLDFFDFDAFHQRAGIGIIISKEFRNRGIAKAALKTALDYARAQLGLKNLYCQILAVNEPSKNLFESVSFQCIGIKKNWHRGADGKWIDELLYQAQL